MISPEYNFSEDGCTSCGSEEVEVMLYDSTIHGDSHLCVYCYETNLTEITDLRSLGCQLTHAFHILERRLKDTKT